MEFLKQYEVLYKKAKADLKAAKILLENFEDGVEELDLETIMFHLQQCAEKLLKSLLAYNKIHFTKTHDIEKLLEELGYSKADPFTFEVVTNANNSIRVYAAQILQYQLQKVGIKMNMG